MIIKIEPYSNGAHANQSTTPPEIPEGWAVIPDGMAIPDTFPFIGVEVAGSTVTSITAGTVPGPDIEAVRTETISAMSAACAATIVSGVEVGGKHYSLSLEDQLNMMNLQGMITAGATSVPYHADGEECKYYTASDFSAIVTSATNLKLYQESYFNSLRAYIKSMTTVDEIKAVTYGMTIPEAYQTDVLKAILAGQTA